MLISRLSIGANTSVISPFVPSSTGVVGEGSGVGVEVDVGVESAPHAIAASVRRPIATDMVRPVVSLIRRPPTRFR